MIAETVDPRTLPDRPTDLPEGSYLAEKYEALERLRTERGKLSSRLEYLREERADVSRRIETAEYDTADFVELAADHARLLVLNRAIPVASEDVRLADADVVYAESNFQTEWQMYLEARRELIHPTRAHSTEELNEYRRRIRSALR